MSTSQLDAVRVFSALIVDEWTTRDAVAVKVGMTPAKTEKILFALHDMGAVAIGHQGGTTYFRRLAKKHVRRSGELVYSRERRHLELEGELPTIEKAHEKIERLAKERAEKRGDANDRV